MHGIERCLSGRVRNNLVVALLVFGPLSLQASSQKSAPATDPLARLMQGNARFMKGQRRPANYVKERRELASGQQPYAIILSCSDSRVPPEIVFDESLGELFVVRVAGNVVDPVALGSIEYAAEHLHAKLLLALGHESCGAVKATIDGGHFSPAIKAIVEKIKPAVDKARREHPDTKDILPFAVDENVALQMKSALDQSEIISELLHKKELQIASAVYRLRTGKVSLLSSASH